MPTESEMSKTQRVLVAAHKVPLLSMVFRKLNSRQREIVEMLKQTSLFSDLTGRELAELLHLLHERTFAAGEVIFHEGDPGFGVYVVFKGEVEISKALKDGRTAMANLGPGEIFGEISLLDGSGRSAQASAAVKTELIGFYRTELGNLLERNPSLASKILFALARQLGMRLRAANEQFAR
ncbi:MAG: Crp/Fnr family transcriptional regulator [Verrucomicrobiae bacterium]|nr:Crp/Fnr family transcriptional regulator [Verrucomicrobiae bacterium]